jgi:hypothetical protein
MNEPNRLLAQRFVGDSAVNTVAKPDQVEEGGGR